MDDPAAPLRINRRPDALDRPPDGDELLIARKRFDSLPVDRLVHEKVTDKIEKVGGRKKTGQ
jgi:hypothetical protein